MQVAVKLYMTHVLPRMLTAFFMGGENIADGMIITYVQSRRPKVALLAKSPWRSYGAEA